MVQEMLQTNITTWQMMGFCDMFQSNKGMTEKPCRLVCGRYIANCVCMLFLTLPLMAEIQLTSWCSSLSKFIPLFTKVSAPSQVVGLGISEPSTTYHRSRFNWIMGAGWVKHVNTHTDDSPSSGLQRKARKSTNFPSKSNSFQQKQFEQKK